MEVGTIYDVVSHEYPAFDLLMLVYSCRVIGEAQPMAREVAEVKWLPAEDLPRLSLLPADEPLARRLASEAAQARSRPGPYFCP